MRPDVLGASVGQVVRDLVSPLLIRLAVVDETRARHDVIIDELVKAYSELRERIAVVETRPPVPGPSGPPGRDGQDGAPGKDGTPGLRYCGVFVDGRTYDLGDLVTWAGSSWHCNEITTTRPGDGLKAWTLMVKRGRDAKEARP